MLMMLEMLGNGCANDAGDVGQWFVLMMLEMLGNGLC